MNGWPQIHRHLTAEEALDIGETLAKIRDVLKPLGLWLAALREHGKISQPQASRYIRYAEMPERARAAFRPVERFSLTAAVGERR